MFGFQTNLFGSLGTSKVVKKVDTFFSVYLTKDDVDVLEREIRHQLKEAAGRNISEREWNTLEGLASSYVRNEEKYLETQKQTPPEDPEAKLNWETNLKNLKKENTKS